jgi:hypothetical protein
MITEKIETVSSVSMMTPFKNPLDPSVILAKLHVAAVDAAKANKLSAKGHFGNTAFNGKDSIYIGTKTSTEFLYIIDDAKLFKLTEKTIRNMFREYLRAFAGFGKSEPISDNDLNIYNVTDPNNKRLYVCPFEWKKPKANTPDNIIRNNLTNMSTHNNSNNSNNQSNNSNNQSNNSNNQTSNTSSGGSSISGRNGTYVVASQTPKLASNKILSEDDLSIDLKEIFLEKLSKMENNKEH